MFDSNTKPASGQTRIRINSYRFFFLLFTIEGWLGFATLFNQPSEISGAVWFGFSASWPLLELATVPLSLANYFSMLMVIVILGMLCCNHTCIVELLNYDCLIEKAARFLAEDLIAYGAFHPNFLLHNLWVRFLALPRIGKCSLPGMKFAGMSMLLVTPALEFLVKNVRKQPWVIGTWLGIPSLLLPLVRYYNPADWQFGWQ